MSAVAFSYQPLPQRHITPIQPPLAAVVAEGHAAVMPMPPPLR